MSTFCRPLLIDIEPHENKNNISKTNNKSFMRVSLTVMGNVSMAYEDNLAQCSALAAINSMVLLLLTFTQLTDLSIFSF
jgi:hypothetical protein